MKRLLFCGYLAYVDESVLKPDVFDVDFSGQLMAQFERRPDGVCSCINAVDGWGKNVREQYLGKWLDISELCDDTAILRVVGNGLIGARHDIEPTTSKRPFTPETLLSIGYIKNEWFSRNDPKGTFDDMKFVEFTKTIRNDNDFKIEVTFYYSAKEEGNFDTLKEISCELNAGGGSYFLTLEQDIEKLETVYEILTNKNK